MATRIRGQRQHGFNERDAARIGAAVRAVERGDFSRRFHRRRYPIATSETTWFWAVIYDKVMVEIEEDTSSDPMFMNPDCPPASLPRYRGEYSWIKVEPNPDDPGEMRPVQPTIFGIAGKCDAAREINRFAGNIHVERMLVQMWEGDAVTCDLSSDTLSSEVEIFASSFDATSTNMEYWFNLAVPREDCASRYSVSAHPLNDVVGVS